METERSQAAGRHRFFISYRHGEHDDVELAGRLARGLEAAGCEVFIDTRIAIGSDWVAEITRRIEWCDFLVVLLSRGALGSEMIQTEVRYAHQRRQREGSPTIVPVRIDYFGPLDYELDAYLGRIQYASWQSAEDSERILGEILALSEDPAYILDPVVQTSDSVDREAPEESGRPLPAVDPRAFSAPGGTLRLNDPFYVERQADAVVTQRSRLEGETLVIKAPRQMGKSSLLLRYLGACRAAGKRIVFLDFSTFSDVELEDYLALLSEIASFLVRALGINVASPIRIRRQAELSHFIEDTILSAVPEPVVLAFDEVDRVLGRPFQADFFTLLRMWHNQRAGFMSPWERVDLALVISTEPYLLIDAGDRSPFNVTPAVELAGFSRDQCGDLNERYGRPLKALEIDSLYELLRGHPYLTRLTFYRLVAADRIDFSKLAAEVESGDGPFGDHLRALLMKLTQQEELLTAMREVIEHGSTPDQDSYFRLHGSGLVRREGGRIVPANQLYSRFFRRAL